LPSLTDLPEFGEGSLKNALPYDEVPKARFTKWASSPQIFTDELKRRSTARIEESPEFHYVLEDMERLRRRLDDNRISLNEDVRHAEMEEDKVRKEARAKDRLTRQKSDASVYRLTLDTVDKPNLQLITFPGKIAAADKKVSPEAAGDADSEDGGDNADGSKDPALDPTRDEALNILGDLVGLSAGPKTASATTAPSAQ
ncbi:MAG: carboxy terminal-processing peptidase, partial [Chthoniobacterales bacterium]